MHLPNILSYHMHVIKSQDALQWDGVAKLSQFGFVQMEVLCTI